MSESTAGAGDVHVPHERAVDEAIDAQLRRTSSEATVAAVTATAISDAASPGSSYLQAEAVAVRTEVVAINARLALVVAALNHVIQVLKDAELLPSA